MDGCMHEWMDEWMDKGVGGWIDRWWMDGWVDGWWVDRWMDRRMVRFQVSAIKGFQGWKEPQDSPSSIPHPQWSPSAQMEAGVDVFLCVRDRWMATWNTGNYECLSRPALDATSSGEFSQIVPPRSPLSVLGALRCYLYSSAHFPCSHLKELCMYLAASLPSELLESRAWLGAARCFPLEVVGPFLAAMVFPCWGL